MKSDCLGMLGMNSVMNLTTTKPIIYLLKHIYFHSYPQWNFLQTPIISPEEKQQQFFFS